METQKLIKLLNSSLRRGEKTKLAKRLSISPQWLSQILTGKENPSLELKKRLTEYIYDIGVIEKEQTEGRQVEKISTKIENNMDETLGKLTESEKLAVELMRSKDELRKTVSDHIKLEKRQEHTNRALLATLDYAECGVIVALQEKVGGDTISYHMNKAAGELLGIKNYKMYKMPFHEHMNTVASRLENPDEWLRDAKMNLMGRKKHDTPIKLKGGPTLIWESKALKDDDGNYFGRIVHLREVHRPD